MRKNVFIFSILLLFLASYCLSPSDLDAQSFEEVQSMMDWGGNTVNDYKNDVEKCKKKECLIGIEKKYRDLVNEKEKECKKICSCSMTSSALNTVMMASAIMTVRRNIFLDLAEHYKTDKYKNDAKRLCEEFISQYPKRSSDFTKKLEELR